MSASLRIANVNVWVWDQDAALDFYVGKLGFVVAQDIDLGFMRWLTVHPEGQPDVQLILCNPEAVLPPEAAATVRKTVADGFGGAPQLLTTDCRSAHAELAARGVSFVQEPTEMGYGIDCELVDPWGNRVRIIERAAVPAA